MRTESGSGGGGWGGAGVALTGQWGASWGPGSSAPRLRRLCRGMCVTRSAEACTDVHTHTWVSVYLSGGHSATHSKGPAPGCKAGAWWCRLGIHLLLPHGGSHTPPQGQRCSGPRESESRPVVSAERPQSSATSADPQAHSAGICSSPSQPHGSLLQGLSLMLPQAPFCLLCPGSGVSPSPVRAQRKPSFCFLPDPVAAPLPACWVTPLSPSSSFLCPDDSLSSVWLE